MKKIIITVLIAMLIAVTANAQETITSKVQWDYDQDELTRVNEFILYYSDTQGGPYQELTRFQIGDLTGDTTFTKEIDVTNFPGITYFVMTASNQNGESDYSNEVILDRTPPNPPTNLKVSLEVNVIINTNQ